MLIRQGDVLLRKIKGLPNKANLKPKDDNCVAYGEVTGHHHKVIDGDVFVDAKGGLYVEAAGKTCLRHQDQTGAVADHQPLNIPAGTYEIVIEEEYTPEGLRRVED